MSLLNSQSRPFRIFLKGLGLGALLVLACYLGFWALTTAKERKLEREWADTVGPMEPFLASLASQRKNAGASRLEEILEPVGIAFVPGGPPSSWKTTGWTQAGGPIHRYIERELEDPRSFPEVPPPEVSAFLEARRGDLDAAVLVLIADEPPRWGEDGNRPRKTESPTHLGFVHLAEWLASDALANAASGDLQRALLDMEALYALGGALDHRLELVVQTASMAIRDFQAGILRKLDPVPPLWKGRLAEDYDSAPLWKAFAYEAYLHRERGRRMSLVPFYRKVARKERILWRTFGRLSYRLNMAEGALRYLRQIRKIERMGPCALDYLGPGREEARSRPWWNTLGVMGPLNFGFFWERGIRLQVDAEFTAKVLEMRESRDRNGGIWPQSIQGIEVSRCPGAHFTYSVHGGAAVLAFDREMKAAGQRGRIILPLRYINGARPVQEALRAPAELRPGGGSGAVAR